MALFGGPRKPPPFPSGRYTITNPLRREYGLRLLTGTMPEPLRALILSAWRRPYLFTGQETPLAVQSGQRQRPDEGTIACATVQTLSWVALTELEVSRRGLEAPMASISRMTRNRPYSSRRAPICASYTLRWCGRWARLLRWRSLGACSCG